MNDLITYVWIEDVREAFGILAEYVASKCEPVFAQTVEKAGEDVLAILRGEWDEDETMELDSPESGVIAFALQGMVN
ncbi:MAG: hypothetical protein KC410_19690 [Anaerolineales bacterium]|nr:hypothetical protein [Anaerolineales bacterium]